MIYSPSHVQPVRLCCYLGMFVQALVINLIPLLFIPLRQEFGLSFEQVGRLILINFFTQLLVDLACCGLTDRAPIKPLLVLANLLAGIGLWIFAGAAWLLTTPYSGLIVGTIVFSAGCGLLEVLLSPVINALPSEQKSADMAFLHAFYPMGKVAVISLTALAFTLCGTRHWPWIMLAWSLFPFINTLAFTRVTLPPFIREEHRQRLRDLCRRPAYWLILIAMVLAGATELTLAQWSSAYVQAGLGYSKFIADMLGFGLFGVGMIVGRLWFGWRGHQDHLHATLLLSATFSALACLIMALCPIGWIALTACAASGLFISMLWPGTVSLAADRFPRAGTSMFALLAAAGDAGAAIVPWGFGWIADRATGLFPALIHFLPAGLNTEQLGLRTGLLLATLSPLLLLLIVAAEKRTGGINASAPPPSK